MKNQSKFNSPFFVLTRKGENVELKHKILGRSFINFDRGRS